MIAQREVVLDANHPVSYKTIYETINAWAGTSYKGYQRGYWDTSEKFWFWFPKLAVFNNGTFKPAYKDDFINTLSKDGCEFVCVEKNGKKVISDDKPILIFAKDSDKNKMYVFRGLFQTDSENTTDYRHVSKRIATKIKLIGQPANDIVILE